MKLDDKTVAQIQGKELKENYGLKNSLESPQYLESRGLSVGTIFRPEFFKQVLNSMGWNSKVQKNRPRGKHRLPDAQGTRYGSKQHASNRRITE